MDEGFYQCFASNQFGTALSIMAHIQSVFLDFPPQGPTVTVTVQEGRPFVIPAARQRSFPKPTYIWKIATSIVDRYPRTLHSSQRMQIAYNGDLCFAYAEKEDELYGKLYKSTAYNPHLSVESYTRVIVTNGSQSLSEFAPNITYSSVSQDVALTGGSVTLTCFFSAKPLPTKIQWTGPNNKLPSGRHRISHFETKLTISDITECDEGNYKCTATNTKGSYQHNLHFRVEAAPKFILESDGPRNINVTEGYSITFNCSASAKPEAVVVWLQNGKPIDVNNPPKRFVFSNYNKSLTIRDVCRDCEDQERQTDLMVIQCNASNVQGYAFASGYLNVLRKTQVEIRGSKNASVDFLEKKQFVFHCHVTADPSTPPMIRWYKVQPYGDLVRDEPPYVYVTDDLLTIIIDPNCSAYCTKYLGEYKCVGDNGYSRESRTITLTFKLPTVVNKRIKERRLPNLPSMYERVDYDAVAQTLEAVGNKEGSMPRACSMYEHIGYDSIDQIPQTPDVHQDKGYESIDSIQKEGANSESRFLDEDTMYDHMGYSIPREEIENRETIDQHQVHIYESVTNEPENFPLSNEQSESMNPYSDLSRKEANPYLDLRNSDTCSREVNRYLDLVSSEVIPCLDLSPKEVNPYLDMGPKEEESFLDLGYLDMGPKEVNPYLDLVSKEVNPYLDLSPKEMNQYLDMEQNEEDSCLDLGYLDMGPKALDTCLYLTPDPVSPPVYTTLHETDDVIHQN